MGLFAWGKRLDDRVARRWAWLDRPMPTNTRLGLLLVMIFGGQLLPRLFFPDAFGGGSLTTGFIVALGIGVVGGLALILAGRRKRRQDR